MSQVLDLVIASRTLAEHGVIDAYGHATVRSGADPQRYLMARNLAPELVTEEDILEFDLDSNAIDAQGRAVYQERFIHGEIYKARPDVMAIVHNHSPSVVPFACTGCEMKPIFHMSAFIGLGVPNWDIRDAQPGSDMLVKTPSLGAHLARRLGPHPAVLMRGHGSTVVGENLQRAVGRTIYLEMNARLQSEAIKLGAVTYLTAEEAAASAKTNDALVMRPWELWKRKAMKLE